MCSIALVTLHSSRHDVVFPKINRHLFLIVCAQNSDPVLNVKPSTSWTGGFTSGCILDGFNIFFLSFLLTSQLE